MAEAKKKKPRKTRKDKGKKRAPTYIGAYRNTSGKPTSVMEVLASGGLTGASGLPKSTKPAKSARESRMSVPNLTLMAGAMARPGYQSQIDIQEAVKKELKPIKESIRRSMEHIPEDIPPEYFDEYIRQQNEAKKKKEEKKKSKRQSKKENESLEELRNKLEEDYRIKEQGYQQSIIDSETNLANALNELQGIQQKYEVSISEGGQQKYEHNKLLETIRNATLQEEIDFLQREKESENEYERYVDELNEVSNELQHTKYQYELSVAERGQMEHQYSSLAEQMRQTQLERDQDFLQMEKNKEIQTDLMAEILSREGLSSGLHELQTESYKQQFEQAQEEGAMQREILQQQEEQIIGLQEEYKRISAELDAEKAKPPPANHLELIQKEARIKELEREKANVEKEYEDRYKQQAGELMNELKVYETELDVKNQKVLEEERKRIQLESNEKLRELERQIQEQQTFRADIEARKTQAEAIFNERINALNEKLADKQEQLNEYKGSGNYSKREVEAMEEKFKKEKEELVKEKNNIYSDMKHHKEERDKSELALRTKFRENNELRDQLLASQEEARAIEENFSQEREMLMKQTQGLEEADIENEKMFEEINRDLARESLMSMFYENELKRTAKIGTQSENELRPLSIPIQVEEPMRSPNRPPTLVLPVTEKTFVVGGQRIKVASPKYTETTPSPKVSIIGNIRKPPVRPDVQQAQEELPPKRQIVPRTTSRGRTPPRPSLPSEDEDVLDVEAQNIVIQENPLIQQAQEELKKVQEPKRQVVPRTTSKGPSALASRLMERAKLVPQEVPQEKPITPRTRRINVEKQMQREKEDTQKQIEFESKHGELNPLQKQDYVQLQLVGVNKGAAEEIVKTTPASTRERLVSYVEQTGTMFGFKQTPRKPKKQPEPTPQEQIEVINTELKNIPISKNLKTNFDTTLQNKTLDEALAENRKIREYLLKQKDNSPVFVNTTKQFRLDVNTKREKDIIEYYRTKSIENELQGSTSL
jgi:hypothetical protein